MVERHLRLRYVHLRLPLEPSEVGSRCRSGALLRRSALGALEQADALEGSALVLRADLLSSGRAGGDAAGRWAGGNSCW
jgi:hypothetical protein